MTTQRIEGPTPNGGTVTLVDYHDLNGAPVDDAASAHTAEFTELDDDGEVIARTYGYINPAKRPRQTADEPYNDDETADAPKVTWDVYAMDAQGIMHLVDNLADLEPIIGSAGLPSAERRGIIAALLTTPAFDNMPARLKTDIYEYLDRTA